MANPIKGRSEEVDIYDFDPGYSVEIDYDFSGLPKKFADKDVEWIVRFDVKAKDPNNKPKNKGYKMKLMNPAKGADYVLLKQDGTMERLSPGIAKDLIAGDPAVGISH